MFTTEIKQMQGKKLSIAEKVLQALRDHYKLRNYAQLAKFLGVTEGSLYSWKSRGSIADYTPFLNKCKGINLEWLQTGEGEMFTAERPGKVSEPETPYPAAKLSPGKQTLVKLVELMTEDEADEIVAGYIQRLRDRERPK